MALCETCGNEYDKAFRVVTVTRRIPLIVWRAPFRRLPPVTIVGAESLAMGVEADGAMFCCAHCASKQGVTTVHDRA